VSTLTEKADLLRSIQSLVSQYVPKGRTIDATLDELAEKWNPLFATEQKKNLVEDVNALVRDFLRPIRRSLFERPPDVKRIHSLAEQLSTSKSLAQIKKRDILTLYIELYMIRCLQIRQA
jgi:predicted transcriptional regulator